MGAGCWLRPWGAPLGRRARGRLRSRLRGRWSEVRGSRGGGLAEAARRVLALPGGAAAELGSAAGGGLARGDCARGRAAAPGGGRAQDGGAAGRRLREASARTGAATPGRKDRDAVRNAQEMSARGRQGAATHRGGEMRPPRRGAEPRLLPKRRATEVQGQRVCNPGHAGKTLGLTNSPA